MHRSRELSRVPADPADQLWRDRCLAKTERAPAWPAHKGLLCTQAPRNLARTLQNRSHLLPLDVAFDLGDFDLQGIQFLIWHQRDVGHGLQFIHHLEAEVRERNVPFAVILLGFAGVERDKNVNRLHFPLLLRSREP